MTIPAEHLAEAYRKVAEANHYLVGVVGVHSWDELSAAEQVLIALDNAADNQDATLNLALDLIEQALKRGAQSSLADRTDWPDKRAGLATCPL